MGARGNSGVITSQIFRGHGRGPRRQEPVQRPRPGPRPVARVRKTAYGAVAKPVEGTILTVIRESAEAAVEAAERDNDIETVLAATLDAAEKSVARTPSLLAILREAGVVDSGGQGLYRLFQGALLHLVGKSPAGAARERVARRGRRQAVDPGRPRRRGVRLRDDVPAPAERLRAARRRRHPRPPRIDRRVGARGRRPPGAQGPRPQRATGPGHRLRPELGALSRISVENLDNQARDVRETRAAAFTQPRRPSGRRVRARRRREAPTRRAPSTRAPSAGARASSRSSPGDGLAAIFRDFGVAAVVQGGQSANPSTGELLEAIGAVDAREIIVLPNNPNVVLAARQVASMTERPVVGRPDAQRRRGLRRAARARPEPRRGGQRRPR